MGPVELAGWLKEKRIPNPTREQALELFAVAYAVWLNQNNNALIAELSGRRRHHLSPPAGPQPFLLALMPYPDDQRARTRSLSRDVCAIRFLAMQGVRPEQVHAASGEGRDDWSRNRSRLFVKVRKQAHDASTQVPEAELTIAVPGTAASAKWIISNKELVQQVLSFLDQLRSEHPHLVTMGAGTGNLAGVLTVVSEPDELLSSAIEGMFRDFDRQQNARTLPDEHL